MRKVIFTFGLIAGAILDAMMLLALPFRERIGFDNAEVLGYTSMILAFLLIFFGIRSYRDNVAGGTVRFGRAVAVGAGIAAVASVCYVATWQVIFFKVAPEFMTEYQAHLMDKARAAGESEASLAVKKAELDAFAVKYQDPFFNAAITFLEPLPVALVVALFSAGVLSRRKTSPGGEVPGLGAPVSR